MAALCASAQALPTSTREGHEILSKKPWNGTNTMTQQLQVLDEAVDTHVETTEGVSVDTLAPLQTICVQTRNNFYRISVVDPETGQALIEGGHFPEPVDALIFGSGVSGTFKFGWIGVGLRLEFWANNTRVSTSPIQSIRVESHSPIESIDVR